MKLGVSHVAFAVIAIIFLILLIYEYKYTKFEREVEKISDSKSAVTFSGEATMPGDSIFQSDNNVQDDLGILLDIQVKLSNLIGILGNKKPAQEVSTLHPDSEEAIIQDTLVSQVISDSRFTIEYSDPQFYKGPIVEGWPVGKDRDMHLYITDDYLVGNISCMNFEDVKLLIIVKSAIHYKRRRQTNRDSWMKMLDEYHGQIKVLHVVSNTDDPQDNEQIRNEMEEYCDILHINVKDHYMNNTLKMVGVLKFLVEHRRLIDPDFVILADDDSFLNIPALWDYMFGDHSTMNRIDFNLYGFVFPGQVMTPRNPNVTFVSKSICPSYMYNRSFYPPHLSGSAFIMPSITIPCIYQECMRMPFFHIDDVFISSFAGERCSFKRITVPGFHPLRIEYKNIKIDDLVYHYINPKYKIKVFERLMALRNDVKSAQTPIDYDTIYIETEGH